MSEDEGIAKRAGRGGVFVLGAKVFFILTGLVQQALLPRVIGLAGYGALSRVLAATNVVKNVVVSASTQGVSRSVAQAKDRADVAQRAALRVHTPIAAGVGIVMAALSGAIAWFEDAPYIRLPLLVMSGVLFLYGVYAPLIGALNGRGWFGKQASLDVLSATLRTAAVLGFGWLFFHHSGAGTLGASVGFVVAAALVLVVALGMTGWGKRGDRTGLLSNREYLRILLPLALAQFFTNALMQQDITLLGRFLSKSAFASGLTGEAAAHAADEWVAVYRACQLFAFLPYQLLFSLTQVLFPMLAHATANGDREAVRTYVARGARLGAIATGAMVAVVAAMPETSLRFAYGATVAARGASTLRVLAIGQGGFAMLGIACTILSSIGKERTSAWLTAGAAVMAASACTLAARHAPFGAAQLHATAWAVSLALGAALLLSAWLVRRATGAFVGLGTAVRVLIALAGTVSIGLRLPAVGRLLAPVEAVGLMGVFLLLLALLREIGREDLRMVAELLRKRRGKGTPG